MTNYIIRRILHLIPVMLLVSIMVFFIFRIVPGDMVTMRLGEQSDPQAAAALRKAWGLDQPLYLQYLSWLGNGLRGDLGTSYINQQSVTGLLMEKAPATVELALLGVLLALVISVPAGIVAGLKRGTWLDFASRAFALVGFCMPRYWLAVLLIMVFTVQAHWLPPAGYVSFTENPVENLRFIAMPVLSVALTLAAVQMRFLRSSLLDVIAQDYIRTAKAKGLSQRAVVLGHALKNSLIPFVTVVGIELGHLLGGLVVVEQIFSWPGIGWLTIQSITQRDYAVVQGAVLLVALGFVAINLLVDILYAYLDPGSGTIELDQSGSQFSLSAQSQRPPRWSGAAESEGKEVEELGQDRVEGGGSLRRTAPRARTAWSLSLSLFRRDRAGMLGIVLFLVVLLSAVFANQVSPYDPTEVHVQDRLQMPSTKYLLGTDELGRDMLSRIIYGARASFSVGVIAVGIAVVVGVVLGMTGGYYGDTVDTVIMRSLDAVLAFPGVILALAIMAVLGSSLTNVMIAVGIVFIPTFARITRGSVLSIREKEFVEAARACGATDTYIMFKSIFPNCLSPLLVQGTVGFANAILVEATLSFLGVGLQPPMPSWGAMLDTGRKYLSQSWLYSFSAGAAIFVSVFSLNLLGDGLRDALDPRMQSER